MARRFSRRHSKNPKGLMVASETVRRKKNPGNRQQRKPPGIGQENQNFVKKQD